MVRWLKYSVLFVFLVGLQVLVFSHIQFRGVANAFPYILFLIALPVEMSGRTVLLLSLLLGFAVDFFTGTLGVHMAACVAAGFLRIMLLPAMAPQGNYEVGTVPSVRDNGWTWFLRYAFIITIVHHFLLFLIESFSFTNIGLTLINMLVSSVLTLFVISIFQMAIKNNFD